MSVSFVKTNELDLENLERIFLCSLPTALQKDLSFFGISILSSEEVIF